VEQDFFTGFPVTLSGKPCYLSAFALPLDAGAGRLRMTVMAEDRAGNRTYAGLPALIRKKKFRSDRIQVSRKFLVSSTSTNSSVRRTRSRSLPSAKIPRGKNSGKGPSCA